MPEQFEGTWEVEDGYVGASRPQSFVIPADEIEDGMTEGDLSDLFWDWLKTEFESRISYYSPDEQKFIEWAKAIQAKGTDNA